MSQIRDAGCIIGKQGSEGGDSVKLAYRNLVRHYRKSILSAAIGIVTIVLLLLYAVNLDSTERSAI